MFTVVRILDFVNFSYKLNQDEWKEKIILRDFKPSEKFLLNFYLREISSELQRSLSFDLTHKRGT